MDPDFIERLGRITLTRDEDEDISILPTHRVRNLEACSFSLLGKFLTTKTLNLWAAKNLLWSIWKLGNDIKILDVRDGLFQFQFTLECQLQWVLSNGPWSFENQILVLRRWEKGMTAQSVVFTHLPMWVQVWGLPFDLVNEDASMDIGRGLGRVVEVDCWL